MKQKKEICVEFEEIKSYEHRWSLHYFGMLFTSRNDAKGHGYAVGAS